MTPDSGASSHISGDRISSTLEPLVEKEKEARGVAWAADTLSWMEFPELSFTGPQSSFNWEG